MEATNEAVATRTEESMVIAGRTDPAFDSDPTLANRWRTIGQDGQAGSGQPFRGGLSYAKISRLKQPPGSLLVEFHAAFSEPEAWFQGASHPPLEVRTDRPGPDSKAAPGAAQEPAEVRSTCA